VKTGNFSVDSKTATSFLTRMEADVTSPLLEAKKNTTSVNDYLVSCALVGLLAFSS